MILNFVFLSTALYFKVQGYPLKHVGLCLAKICLAAGIMGGAVHLLATGLKPLFTAGLASQVMILGILLTWGLLVYSLIIYFFKVPEFQELVSHLQRMKKRN